MKGQTCSTAIIILNTQVPNLAPLVEDRKNNIDFCHYNKHILNTGSLSPYYLDNYLENLVDTKDKMSSMN